jgi:hypothetical protein
VAPNVRPAAPETSRSTYRQPAGWVWLLLALVGCLNPQPDPFPQNVEDAPPESTDGPSDVRFAPSAPATPGSAAGTSTAPTPTRNDNAAEQPATPMAATPPPAGGAPADAGALQPDAGANFDAGVPANGF